MKLLYVAFVSIILTAVSASTANASGRVALVIGNSEYEHVAALPNPTNDADGISAALAQVGFDVTVAKDLSYQKMRLALREFSDKAIGSEIALVYYAGHGIEVDKNNYLVPTDARLKKDIDVEFEALSLDQVNLAVSGATGLKMILLDACRDNPFAQSMTRTVATRSIGRGLARVEPVNGSLISFAAKEGTVASDGTGKHSPYTSALIKHITEPGLDIQLMFRKVRDSVLAETNKQQEPFTYASLPGHQIFLTPGESSSGNNSDNSSKPAAQNDSAVEISFWNSVQSSDDPNVLQLYLDKYPNGAFAAIAKAKISSLKRKNEPEVKPQPKEQEIASLPRTRNVHNRNSQIHLGDENIRRWARLHGQCYSVSVPSVRPGGRIQLNYQGYGVEAAYVRVAAQSKRLPAQKSKPGKKRPNYWSGNRSIEFFLPDGYNGGQLSICTSDVKDPEFAGDIDDLMLRRIAVRVFD